jgi:hypothetical protein
VTPETGKIIPLWSDAPLSKEEIQRVVNVVDAIDDIKRRCRDGVRTNTRGDYEAIQRRLSLLARYMQTGDM